MYDATRRIRVPRVMGRMPILLALLVSGWSAIGLAELVDGEPLRDPTRPTAYRAPAASTEAQKTAPVYRLQGLIVAEGRQQALINGSLRSPGERLGNARIVSIEGDRVVLDVAGEQRVLRWKPPGAVYKTPSESGRLR